MRSELVFMAMLIGLGSCACAVPLIAGEAIRASQPDLDTVRARLYASLAEMSDARQLAVAERADGWLRTIQQDGSWADQDYADTNRERWKCIGHLPRLVDLATAGRLGNTPSDKQAQYIAAAVKALQFWLRADPKNTNWWHNEIGVPLQVGNALILLGDDAPSNLRMRGAELMKRSKWSTWTGQNLVWGTRIQVIRSCITGDGAAAAEAFTRMYEEVRINPGRAEGIKPDWSFYQHGELLYSGGYGSGFTGDTARLALLARETSFAIPADKLEILVSHLLDGQAWMTRGHYWDYSVTGREIVRMGKNARSLATPARDLAVLYPGRRDELLALAARLSDKPDARPLTGNRHFWYSDYMVHHRAGWFASARMYSARTKNTDPLINGESRRSHYLAEGVNYIMLTGSEYEDIFPAWDWHKIPGATIEQGTAFDPKTVSRMGVEWFVGGASDGTYGCATMDMVTGPLRAKKSWFFFDEGFVALGAGISCLSDNPVVTTINQCLLNGEAKASDGDGPLARGEHDSAYSWFWHADIGYLPLTPMAIDLRNETQRGSWNDIASGASADSVERDVFVATIDHGRRPQDAQYAYLVLPAASAEKTAAAAANRPVRVLSNTPALQAVRHDAAGMTQAIFREPGSIECGGMNVAANMACALIVRQQGEEVSFTAANPLNEAAELVLLVSARLGGENTLAQPDGRTRITLPLPGGAGAGKSVTLKVRRTNQ